MPAATSFQKLTLFSSGMQMLTDVLAPFAGVRPVQIQNDVTSGSVHHVDDLSHQNAIVLALVGLLGAFPNQRSCESGRRMVFACQSRMAVCTVSRMCPSPSLVHSIEAVFTPRRRTGSPALSSSLRSDDLECERLGRPILSGDGQLRAEAIPHSRARS